MGPFIVIYIYSETNYMHNFLVYWISLHMFRMVLPSIIRSWRLYTQHQAYVIQVSWLLSSGHKMELHLMPASKQSTNLHDIYLMLCVQPWTPDDGRKDRPKHVEWYSINSKIVHLVGSSIETDIQIMKTIMGSHKKPQQLYLSIVSSFSEYFVFLQIWTKVL
jgi:hypothetical protein